MDMQGNWYTVGTCWSDEPHSHFVLYNQYSKEKNPTCVISSRKLSHWLAFGHSLTSYFRTWYSYGDHLAEHFDTSLDDLDLKSRSQFVRNDLALCSFSANFSIDLDEI